MPLTSADRVVLDGEVFKYVTSSTSCNLIGAPRSWRTDSFWYRQSARPSLRVFILKELNAAGGSGLACETNSMLVCFVQNGNGRFLAGAKINLLTRHLARSDLELPKYTTVVYAGEAFLRYVDIGRITIPNF